MSEADDPRIAVFRGTRAACLEASLVLDAKGLPYDFTQAEDGWVLLMEPGAAAFGREELSRYALERSVVRESPPRLIVFKGSGFGAGVYAAVLLITAYCAGIRAFGADWLEAGSLDARAADRGQWWRAVTALTLHLDQSHLLGNLLFGIGFGVLAGRAFGPGVAWASVLIAGSVANYVDMLISPSWHRAVGASTAVFAALGLLSGFAWRGRLPMREQFRYRWAPLFAGVCLLALLGSGDEHVDVLAHALGFAAALPIGWFFAKIPPPRTGNWQAIAGAAALGLVAVAWTAALLKSLGPHRPV